MADPSLTVELRIQASASKRLPTEVSAALWIAPYPPPRPGERAESGHEDAPSPSVLLLQRFLWLQPGEPASALGYAWLVSNAHREEAPQDLQALRSDRVGHSRH